MDWSKSALSESKGFLVRKIDRILALVGVGTLAFVLYLVVNANSLRGRLFNVALAGYVVVFYFAYWRTVSD